MPGSPDWRSSASLLALSPWIVRNLIHFGELIPVSDEGGCAFFDGNSNWANRLYELKDQKQVESINLEMHRDKVERLVAAGSRPGDARFRVSIAALDGARAVDSRRAPPRSRGHVAALRPQALALDPTLPDPLLEPAHRRVGERPLRDSVRPRGRGLATAARRGAVRFSIAVLVLSTALHVLVLVLWRYRVPYWDPILLLYGVFGITRFAPGRARLEAA